MERETERKNEEEEEEDDVKDTGVLGHEEDDDGEEEKEDDDDEEEEEGDGVTDKGVLGHEHEEEDGEEEEGDAVTDKGVLGHEHEEEDDDDDDEEEEEGDGVTDKGVLGHEHEEEDDEEEEEDGVTDKGVLGHEEEEKGDDEGGSNRTECVEEDEKDPVKKKKPIPGIIYLGHIPPRLRPKHMRNMLTPYGEIGRIFLQPEDRAVRQKRKKAKSRGSNFTEGWVEFSDKRIAKRVAASLHNTPMGNKKHHRFHADLWNIKYLHRFHWSHLSERLVYEQTVLRQRLRTEVSQAKRETNFFLGNVDKSQSMAKRRKKMEKQGDTVEERSWDFTQRLTEEEIQQQKKTRRSQQDKTRLIQEKSQSNVSLLAKIFNAGGQKQN